MLKKLKSFFTRMWNRLLSKTTIDENLEELIDNAKRTIVVKRDQAGEAIEDLVEDIKEDLYVLKGKVTKSRLRAMKKADLIKNAFEQFDESVDKKLDKTAIINKLYSLHNKNKK